MIYRRNRSFTLLLNKLYFVCLVLSSWFFFSPLSGCSAVGNLGNPSGLHLWVCMANPPRTFFNRDNRSSSLVGSLFSWVLTSHLCTKPIEIASIQEQQKVQRCPLWSNTTVCSSGVSVFLLLSTLNFFLFLFFNASRLTHKA